ncbi:MAG: hypothetical protein IPN53_02505 [Comamonadaceae bacterium]|nr:hypothetical protein [Comamonadaceae bacterium]
MIVIQSATSLAYLQAMNHANPSQNSLRQTTPSIAELAQSLRTAVGHFDEVRGEGQ